VTFTYELGLRVDVDRQNDDKLLDFGMPYGQTHHMAMTGDGMAKRMSDGFHYHVSQNLLLGSVPVVEHISSVQVFWFSSSKNRSITPVSCHLGLSSRERALAEHL